MQRTAIFVAKNDKITVEGAAHRDINLILRCAAPSKRGKHIVATNIAVRCTFKTRKTYYFYKYCGALHIRNARCGNSRFVVLFESSRGFGKEIG